MANQYLAPGIDSNLYLKTLHQGVASSLSQGQKVPVNPADLLPVHLQSPVLPNHPLMAKPGSELEINELTKNKDQVFPEGSSKNFLKAFLQRLKKQNPGSLIQKEG